MDRTSVMTKWSLISNLKEAKEELENLISKLESEEEPSWFELFIGFEHAYRHLNIGWNTRRSPDEKVIKMTWRDFRRWGKFPLSKEWIGMYRSPADIAKVKAMPKCW